jgi:hypothetical protein
MDSDDQQDTEKNQKLITSTDYNDKSDEFVTNTYKNDNYRRVYDVYERRKKEIFEKLPNTIGISMDKYGENDFCIIVEVNDATFEDDVFPGYEIEDVPILYQELVVSYGYKEWFTHKEFDITKEQILQINSIVDQIAQDDKLFSKHSNLKMIGGGWREKRGRRLQQLCIVLSVEKKGITPEHENEFPGEIRGFPVDIREFKPHLHCRNLENEYYKHDLQTWGDSLSMGCDIYGQMRGSIGCFVKSQNRRAILSCKHVLFEDNNNNDAFLKSDARVIHVTENYKYDDILYYQDSKSTTIIHPTVRGRGIGETDYSNQIACDAAIAFLKDNIDIDKNLLNTGVEIWNQYGFDEIPKFTTNYIKEHEINNLMNPKNDVWVYKCGVGTGLTRGKLSNFVPRTTYETSKRKGLNIFEIKLHNECFAFPGDSGALVFIIEDGKIRPLGIHYFEASYSYYSIPLYYIMEELKIELIGPDDLNFGQIEE